MRTARSIDFFAWLPVAALCAAIFLQSCFASPDIGPSFPLKDKALHAAVYALLAGLVFRACRLTWPAWRAPIQILVVSVAFATLFGAGDELHQAFVATRQADALDLLADLVGSLVGGGIYLTICRRPPKATARPSTP
ncbi:VanZ family protein [Desulfosarcina ovata]|uniref:VanZ family protein n=1 Tax=Desulfosarcina ovata TaxID=83564 RepID=UPI0012D2F835|nr:VanZ family protein [Desulfosarcina ovata]